MFEYIKGFVKREIVLSIAIVLTVITCFFVPIDKEYLGYFEVDTLLSLFSMLVVVTGLKKSNVFDIISRGIISLFKNRRSLITGLVFGTFIFDMIVANDMSLITFLPLSYIVLHSTSNDKYLAITFILQTIAANMGGMITPYGNPQNLYLYSFFDIGLSEFIKILLPQYLLVIVLLFIACRFISKEPLRLRNDKVNVLKRKQFFLYFYQFIIVIASIFRLIPTWYAFFVVVLFTFMIDRRIFKDVDYALLATFIVFFIFSGNIARISFLSNFITGHISKSILLVGIISCQFISNVPSAILISKFTSNYSDLLIAVNIGSLGILISSLASLITLKAFLKYQPGNFKKYICIYTVINLTFLFIIIVFTYLIR